MAILTSCEQQNISFDSEIWKSKGLDWWMTDVREKMIDDLIDSDTLIGLHKQSVIELLGKPSINDSTEFQYLVREKYTSDIDPDYIKYLIVEFDESGKSQEIRIHQKK